MILTVTMNPSVDISYPLDNFFINQVNRCQETKKTAGGKGLNVTRVIHQMERPVVATGLLGGALGTFIEEQLESQKIVHHFSKIEGDTRNCIAVLHDGGKQTEISEAGPTVSKDELDQFEAIFTEEGKNAKVVTISGSLPKGAPSSYYVNLLEDLKETDTRVILDTSGQSLKDVLNSEVKPFAIKPNLEELEGLTGTKIELDEKQLTTVLSDSLFEGVELILVSLGKDGAFVKDGKDFYRVRIPIINVVNPVGSGDSTVAGLAIALSEEASIEDILKTAMTLGMLNTMENQTGFVNITNFKEYFDQVEVLKVDL